MCEDMNGSFSFHFRFAPLFKLQSFRNINWSPFLVTGHGPLLYQALYVSTGTQTYKKSLLDVRAQP